MLSAIKSGVTRVGSHSSYQKNIQIHFKLEDIERVGGEEVCRGIRLLSKETWLEL